MTDHRVHVVTDSTASLPAGSDERLRAVPLHVVVDDESYLEASASPPRTSRRTSRPVTG